MKKISKIVAFSFVMIMLLSQLVGASTPYQSYTYSIDGFIYNSPDAYVPDLIVDSKYIGLEEGREMSDVRDVEIDSEGNVYIVEASLNRVIVTDRYYKYKFELDEFINSNGIPDKFNGPQGVFVSEEYIYVCDSMNSRIVMFDREGKYVKTVLAPQSNLFDEGDVYTPIACAVDEYGRMFVVSSTTNQGIIVMSDDGSFFGFIGAQKVTYNALDFLWRRLFNNNSEGMLQIVPTEYNNIDIDEDNFVYVTISSIDPSSQQNAIKNKDKSGDYAPVKKLNATGLDVLRRNGFYPPSGEVMAIDAEDVSKIIDVAVGPEKTWSILDEKHSKVFTYDREGNLLFAFGDTGVQTGNISSGEAMAYHNDKMLVLDKGTVSINVYRRTEYGNVLMNALINQNNRQYDRAMDDWREILKRNNNFDIAYIGIGQGLFREHKYEEAGKYFKSAWDVGNYSSSFAETRKAWANKYFWIIPVVVVAVCLGISKILGLAAKINKKAQFKAGQRTLVEEIAYSTHLMFHPFDGFWDLKHEKRGGVRAGVFFLAFTIAAFYYKDIGTGYIFSADHYPGTIFQAILSVMVPFLLFIVANWCLTTLLEGEGSFKDVFVASSYALSPLPFLIILSTVASNFLVQNESAIMTMITTVGFAWVALLLFFGIMVTHGYSMGKNIVTVIATVIGMAFIMFLSILFSNLMTKIVALVVGIFEEINYRA